MGQSTPLFDKRIKCGNKNFFFNVKKGSKSRFLVIVESRPVDGKFERNSILVFEDDLKLFKETLEDVVRELQKGTA